MPSCDRRYFTLAAGTIVLIQLSCVIEEWIFKQMSNGKFKYFWFVALVELLLFTVLGYVASARQQNRSIFELPTPAAPLHLYAAAGFALAAGTGLGKIAYKYLNYATGTVLKSMKLLPVMALSVCWLRRSFNGLQIGSAVFMVLSACYFALGEKEVEPDFDPMGLLLSAASLFAQALQNNAQDTLLRDHQVPVHEAMTLANGAGFVAVLGITIVNGELLPAFAFFSRSWTYWALLIVRCLLFYLGALLYTMLMQDSGAVGAVFVTTMRKALTMIVSFVVFPKPWSGKYTIGGILLLASIYCEYQGNATAKEKTKAAHAEKSHGTSEAPEQAELLCDPSTDQSSDGTGSNGSGSESAVPSTPVSASTPGGKGGDLEDSSGRACRRPTRSSHESLHLQEEA